MAKKSTATASRKARDAAIREIADRAKYPAKTSMHPKLRHMLGEILAIELDLAAKGVLWAR